MRTKISIGINPNYANYLSNFGEIGVVSSIATIKAKLKYQVITSMFICCRKNCTGGTYQILNIHMKHIILSRDAIWVKKHMVSTYQENKITRRPDIQYPSR